MTRLGLIGLLGVGLGAVVSCAPDGTRRQLYAPSAFDRSRAAIQSAEARDADAIPLLVNQLEDHDAAVRLFAIQALQRISGETLGFEYYAPPDRRATAVARWRAVLREGRFHQVVQTAPGLSDGLVASQGSDPPGVAKARTSPESVGSSTAGGAPAAVAAGAAAPATTAVQSVSQEQAAPSLRSEVP